MAKRGRPKSDRKPKQGIGLSLEPEVVKKLDELASLCDLTRSQVADYIFRRYFGLNLPNLNQEIQNLIHNNYLEKSFEVVQMASFRSISNSDSVTLANREDWETISMILDSNGEQEIYGYIDLINGEVLISSPDAPLPFEIEESEDDDEDGYNEHYDPLRYLPIPNNGSKDSYQDMVDFTKLVSNPELKQDLENALEKRRPFRHFKDVINGSDQQERWCEFSERCRKARVICWLGSNNIWLPSEKNESKSAYKASSLMDKRLLLAAELYDYSYANYDNHLGIGNMRFDELMPQSVDILEKDLTKKWDDEELAEALDIEIEDVEKWRAKYKEAREIIYAENPAESFKKSVKKRILFALKEDLTDERELNRLVKGICYCAADLAFLLDLEGKQLSDYSYDLRYRRRE